MITKVKILRFKIDNSSEQCDRANKTNFEWGIVKIPMGDIVYIRGGVFILLLYIYIYIYIHVL